MALQEARGSAPAEGLSMARTGHVWTFHQVAGVVSGCVGAKFQQLHKDQFDHNLRKEENTEQLYSYLASKFLSTNPPQIGNDRRYD